MLSKLFAVLLALSSLSQIEGSSFKLKIIHFNDLHARFDEVTNKSVPCAGNGEPCVGGVARLVTTIEKLKKENLNHLVLNAGDVFQGTIWYTLLKWNVSQMFMNMVKPNAMTLGNHEFDDAVAGLVPFLNGIKDVTPVLVSNLVFPWMPSNELKQLRSLIKEEPLILKVGDRSVGIIGVIFDETDKITNTHPLKFKSSIESVRAATKALKSKGVNIIIVLSHCGIFDDKKIAEQAGDDIDIIVGGHTHTLLYNGEPPSKHTVLDKYPMVVESANKHKVLIVQAFCHSMYVGNIDLTFDDRGEITSYEGQPIYQSNDIEKNPSVEARVKELRKDIEVKSSVTVGKSEVELSNDCRRKECTFGSVLADAYVWYFRDKSRAPKIAMIHPGNFRISLASGAITRGQLLTALPFNSNANWVKVSGATIKKAIEYGVSINPRRCSFNALQTAGIRTIVNYGKPVGNRAKISLKSGEKFKPLDEKKEYNVLVNSYIFKGGDGFDMFVNCTVKGRAPMDAELLEQYIAAHGKIEESKLLEPRTTATQEKKASEEVEICKAFG
ncbi:apyrase-like [Aedes albopictus]|uniref:apyrase n=1 Tax=Aedes albopictus TaxID=7160 RepID=A0ABM1YQ27_AEDAL|nr:apyrase-like [Aedes albopictus]